MNASPLASASDIEKIAKNILLGSKSWGEFPTPIQKITTYVGLQLEKGVNLSNLDPGFFSKNLQYAQRAVAKVLGLIDIRKRVIYLDQSQIPTRKNFIQLHEVGHDACSWQSKLIDYLDDERTLDPDTAELFEREASFFASSGLFQCEIFESELEKLPLSLNSARVLAKQFGGSCHASLRRYVERSPKRCALLVLHKPEVNGEFHAKIRNYFQSPAFTASFGNISWSDGKCGMDWIFIKEIKRKRKLHADGQVALMTSSGESITFEYHFFNNSHNTFIFLLPPGEKIKSRITIVPT
jgi:Zn-dependent peptidase ImmA (M78 family)